MVLAQLWMVSHLLLAMSVPFLCAGHAMNMKGRMGISHVPNAKLDTRDIKVMLLSFSVLIQNSAGHILLKLEIG